MLERLGDVPEGIVGAKAAGRVTRGDYEKVLEPLLEGARREGRRLRFLYEAGPEFEGFAPGAAWEDAKLGLKFMRVLAACAVVTDHGRIREATRIASFFMPCPVKAFATTRRDEAIAWLGSIPHEVGVAHRLLTDKGVLVVDAKGALKAQDFDTLAVTVDPWIESHGELQGVVVHARAFPGWDNLGAFVRHVQFVRDHHRKIRRIALAVDGSLAHLAPRVGEHFVQAEVKTFGYDQIEAAILWATGAGAAG